MPGWRRVQLGICAPGGSGMGVIHRAARAVRRELTGPFAVALSVGLFATPGCGSEPAMSPTGPAGATSQGPAGAAPAAAGPGQTVPSARAPGAGTTVATPSAAGTNAAPANPPATA